MDHFVRSTSVRRTLRARVSFLLISVQQVYIWIKVVVFKVAEDVKVQRAVQAGCERFGVEFDQQVPHTIFGSGLNNRLFNFSADLTSRVLDLLVKLRKITQKFTCQIGTNN
ncbi:hypothetical protein BpHYR1_023228 [Brachionus plicatilis]|uniref:Uncharacterized protein n=1 Tax=Brachionus plicatilis TaxID=10195 RepID=A0A3M7ST73_BRAPC|nr:hypothetical protein BpHYR1_023228 [Brachionus plicatilis]